MRTLARILPLAVLAVALTACSGASVTHGVGASGSAPASSKTAVGTGPLGMLPIPAGARPYGQYAKPATLLPDTTVGGVGWVNPTPDAYGDTMVQIAVVVHDEVVLVTEYTAATPDPAAAKALTLRQYDSLKSAK